MKKKQTRRLFKCRLRTVPNVSTYEMARKYNLVTSKQSSKFPLYILCSGSKIVEFYRRRAP